MKDEGLVLVNADKGEALIIMNRSAYVDRVLKFLEDSGAVPVQFSVQSYNGTTRTAIKSSTIVNP